ncbi:MAG: hypothetical protein PHO92_02250, partial [Candidatus Peribacteraceae bacterium]|nr:hypothetical protein [Candidatus Peribacteraceae bacterium]
AHGRDDVTGGTASFKERFDSVIPAHEEHADRLDDTYESFAAGHDEVSARAREVLERLGIPSAEIERRFEGVHGRKEHAKFGTFAARREQHRAVKEALRVLRENETEGNRDDFVRAYVVESDSNVDDWFFMHFESETAEIFMLEGDPADAFAKAEALVKRVMAEFAAHPELQTPFMEKVQERAGMEDFQGKSPEAKLEILHQIVELEALELAKAAGLMRFLANMPAEALDAYYGKTLDPDGNPAEEPNMLALFNGEQSIGDVVPAKARVQVIINNKTFDWYMADKVPAEVTAAMRPPVNAKIVQLFYREDKDVNALMAHLSIGQVYRCKRADSDTEIVLEGTMGDAYKVVSGLSDAEVADFQARPMKYLAYARPGIDLNTTPTDGGTPVRIPEAGRAPVAGGNAPASTPPADPWYRRGRFNPLRRRQ